MNQTVEVVAIWREAINPATSFSTFSVKPKQGKALIVLLPRISFRRFLGSNSLEALLYKGFRPDIVTIEGRDFRINALSTVLIAVFA